MKKVRDSQNIKYSEITIANCQVKSIEKAKLFCKSLDVIEKEIGIRETRITFENVFICPDIDLNILAKSVNPMESLVGKLFIKLHKLEYGKKSKYK